VRHLARGVSDEMTFSRNEIVFEMEGKIRFRFRDHPEKLVGKGYFVFLPVGGLFRYKAVKDSVVMVIRLHRNVKLCEGFIVEQLLAKSRPQEEMEKPESVTALEILPPIWHFLEGLNGCISDGLRCANYFNTKIEELFILLFVYYSKESLHDFFSLILSPDTLFSEQVRLNYHKYHTAQELAHSMHMTVSKFNKKFKSVFGMPPYQWMLEGKAKRIHSEVYSGNKPLKQIAEEYGFTAQSHLNRFCKEIFGINPGEIRKKREQMD
jgi:AraC-like DNA-binding protein